jgi:hypothetical protein
LAIARNDIVATINGRPLKIGSVELYLGSQVQSLILFLLDVTDPRRKVQYLLSFPKRDDHQPLQAGVLFL